MGSSFDFWEIVLRSFGMAWALLLAASLALWASEPHSLCRRWRSCASLVLTFLAWASYLACSTSGNICGTSLWLAPVVALNLAFPFALWWLARVLLSDDTRWPTPWEYVALLGLLGSGSVAVFLRVPQAAWVQKIFAYGFLALIFVQIWRGAEGDLIEQRRTLRRVVIGTVGIYSAAVLAVELWLGASREQAPLWLMWLHLLAMNAGLIIAAFWFMRPSPVAQSWLEPQRLGVASDLSKRASTEEAFTGEADEQESASSSPVLPETPALDLLAARAQTMMLEQRLYHDSELSLAALATALAVPQYLLRRAIHESLGYRNFASFVNEARLTEVTQHLQDPALDRRPILTLALEAGFGSIGPFNRAFRERFNCTPTEYRQLRGSPRMELAK